MWGELGSRRTLGREICGFHGFSGCGLSLAAGFGLAVVAAATEVGGHGEIRVHGTHDTTYNTITCEKRLIW